MSAFERIVERLERFKPTGPDTGIASCPTAAHRRGDLSRGLALRRTGDRVLIFCHAGCTAEEITNALGISVSDLFDELRQNAKGLAISRRIPARDLLEILDHEALTVGMIALEFRNHRELSEEDWRRLSTAAARIGRARDHARGC